MNTRVQQWCAWSGIAFLLIFGLGWVFIAGFLPPPSPAFGGERIAQIYQSHSNAIRLGMLLTQLACIFYPPWVAGISAQMSRIEGSPPVLSWTQMISGVLGMFVILLAALIWSTVAFRPDRDPELLLLLNDLAWIVLAMTFAPFVTQSIAITAAVLLDRSADPVFPRWYAYFNIWVATMFLPIGLIAFFKHGPFAWNGLFGIWLPVFDFGLWFLITFRLLQKAIRQQAQAGSATRQAA